MPLCTKSRPVACAATLVLLASSLTSCLGSGPRTVGRDRFDYVDAIASSQDQQLLLNLVRARYAESPMFLDVGSVVSGYEFERTGRATWADVGLSTDAVQLGVEGRWLEQPTITYEPVTGKRFDRVLVTPLPPGAVLYFMQAGWPAELVVRMAVDAINGHRNGSFLAARGPLGDETFESTIAVLSRRLSAGSLGFRLERDEKGGYTTTVLLLDDRLPTEAAELARQLREGLGLAPEGDAFPVAYGPSAGDPETIYVLTRPLLQILNELSAGVELPDGHEARAMPLVRHTERDPLIRVHCGGRPSSDEAFVAVRHRDHWFWIADDDLQSKRAFGLLVLLFHVMAANEGSISPVLTIPT